MPHLPPAVSETGNLNSTSNALAGAVEASQPATAVMALQRT